MNKSDKEENKTIIVKQNTNEDNNSNNTNDNTPQIMQIPKDKLESLSTYDLKKLELQMIKEHSKKCESIEISMEDVEKHNTKESLWTILKDKVYDVTNFLESHPGGVNKLMLGAGADCTPLFSNIIV